MACFWPGALDHLRLRFDNRRQPGGVPTGRTIRAAAAAGAVAAIPRAQRAPLIAAAGLCEADLSDPDHLLELDLVLRLDQAAAEATRDDCLGLRVGESWALGDLGVLSYAVSNAPTVGTGLRNLERYGRSHVQGGRIELAVARGEARLVYALEASDPELARQHVESAAVVGLRIVRELAGAHCAHGASCSAIGARATSPSTHASSAAPCSSAATSIS